MPANETNPTAFDMPNIGISTEEAIEAFSKFSECAAKVPKEDLAAGIMANATLSTREKKKLIKVLEENNV